jgi:hypothetical protein
MFAAAALPQTARAQNINIAAGASFPTGDLGNNGANTGWLITGGVGMAPTGSPLGFRAEAIYNQYTRDCSNSFFNGCPSGAINVWGVTGNAVYNLPLGMSSGPAGSGATVYGIGGVGVYGGSDPLFTNSNDFSTSFGTNFGWNIGGGVKFALAGFSAYVEARYHSFNTQGNTISFVPIVFGVTF